MATDCAHAQIQVRDHMAFCIMCGIKIGSGRCSYCSRPMDDHIGLLLNDPKCPKP